MKRDKFYLLAVIFFCISLIFSIYLHLNKPEEICSLNSCDVVRNSEYSKILGVELTFYALMTFPTIILLIFLANKIRIRSILLGLCFIVFVFAFYFIFLQFFVIKSICFFCLITNISAIIGCVAVFFDKWKKK